MTKQRTDNLGLILLDDHDEDSFFADHVENLGKINAPDKAQTQARTAGERRHPRRRAGIRRRTDSGQSHPLPVREVSTSNITLSSTQTVDGAVLAVGDSVGAFGQTNGAQNGVCLVQPGPWTRRPTSIPSASSFAQGHRVAWLGHVSRTTVG